MARGDVFVIELPESELREQTGRRPAVAVQMDVPDGPMLVVAPITSNLAALRFAFAVRVEPSPENGLTVSSVVMVYQIRAVDKRRIIRKIGQMGAADMTRIDAEIWRMLKPAN